MSDSQRRPGATASVLLAVLAGLLLAAAPASAQPADTFTPDQFSGDLATVFSGVTSGPCDRPGTPDVPVDGYNAVVVGPGMFAPNATEGTPDGVIVVSTDDVGFSTTGPIPFRFRAGFPEMAAQLGAPLLPGEYVVTFRCVNQLYGEVFQTYTATYRFTGGPPATAFTVTNPVPDLAAPAPLPEALLPDAQLPPASAAPAGSVVPVVTSVALAVAAAGLLAYVLWRRRAHSRS